MNYTISVNYDEKTKTYKGKLEYKKIVYLYLNTILNGEIKQEENKTIA